MFESILVLLLISLTLELSQWKVSAGILARRVDHGAPKELPHPTAAQLREVQP